MPIASSARMLDVLIDPGHGGHAPLGRSTPYGSRASDGRLEKDLNLEVARALQSELRASTQLTRTDDHNLRLGTRAEHARHLRARSFVSVHSDPGTAESRVWVHEQAGPGSHALADAVCSRLNAYGAAAQVVRGPMTVLDPSLLGRERAGCMVELGARALGNPRGAASAIARGVEGWLGAQPRPRWGGPARISENDPDPRIWLLRPHVEGSAIVDADRHRIVVATAGDLSIGVHLQLTHADVSELHVEVRVESGPPSAPTVHLRDYITLSDTTPVLWGRSVPVPVGEIRIVFDADRLRGTAPPDATIAEGELTL